MPWLRRLACYNTLLRIRGGCFGHSGPVVDWTEYMYHEVVQTRDRKKLGIVLPTMVLPLELGDKPLGAVSSVLGSGAADRMGSGSGTLVDVAEWVSVVPRPVFVGSTGGRVFCVLGLPCGPWRPKMMDCEESADLDRADGYLQILLR